MRIAIIGAAGQLGQDLVNAFLGHAIYSPSHQDLDIVDEARVLSYINDLKPEIVINTAAFHDVPKCEQSPDKAFEVNAIGPRNLAKACELNGTRFFHLSTDYVFKGDLGRPCREDDVPFPLMVYGASKLAGEHLAVANCKNTYIVRTTGLFGKNPCRAKPGGRNFVDLMLHLGKTNGEVKVVDDQRCCPTYTLNLARQIKAMIEADIEPGIYHAVTPPGLTWADFAKMIFEKAGLNVKLTRVSSDAFPVSFRRPADSRLENAALNSAKIFNMQTIDKALAEYMKDI